MRPRAAGFVKRRWFSKLNHPNIATIHDFDTQDGIDFIILDLIPGQDPC